MAMAGRCYGIAVSLQRGDVQDEVGMLDALPIFTVFVKVPVSDNRVRASLSTCCIAGNYNDERDGNNHYRIISYT